MVDYVDAGLSANSVSYLSALEQQRALHAAVVEGRARGVASPEDVEVVRAPGSGDDTIVEVAADLVGEGRLVAVVTADRGLRARLPEGVRAFGPRWLRDLLDAAGSAAP